MGKALLIVMTLTSSGKHDYLNSTSVSEVSSMAVCRLAEKSVQHTLEGYHLTWEIKTECKPISAAQ